MLTEEQLALRRTGVTATDISAILGLHPFRNQHDVLRSKLEPDFQPETNDDMERGYFFEEPTAQWWAKKRGGSLLTAPGTLAHPRNKLVIATPDYLAKIDNRDIDLSIKVPGPFSAYKWGESDTDNAPEYAVIQLQWELSILLETHGIKDGEIAAEVSGALRWYPMEADGEFQGMLIQAGEKFFHDHVTKRIPLMPDASDSCTEWLKAKAKTKGEILPATDAAEALVMRIKEEAAAIKEHERLEDSAKNQLKALIGEQARGMAGWGWRAQWSDVAGSVCERKATKAFRVTFHQSFSSHPSREK